ncbi:hypothetical protein G6F70_003713 [Rhizopus microsporus]|uniref:RRM domain-containing protein n=2 Tax=Rhizopus TaxID=4842 RepID=A0A367K0U4_RHIAZ|nr:hypothetical protein G6F71_008503 [Rhizopus microsporus]RCH95767.1 hypothetical protein CU097_014146 [Rhizopus azygosporus]KAG1200828.1 hypothetical protein G6F70_003713 [Rhizopus microsporus]KAG1206889.1 hypothetical protein G6F69_008492 [Rhizopus microsporus]KAG1234724.1 hypothetical protein G6F67_003313 [Rhizopus microsporus]
MAPIKSEQKTLKDESEEYTSSSGEESYESDNDIKQEDQESDEDQTNDQEASTKREREEEEEEEEETKPVEPKRVRIEKIEKKNFGQGGTTVFVGQLNFNAKADDIRQYFSQCGPVVDVRLRMHPNGQKSRGFAHVEFATAQAKKAALELDGSEFMGRTIRVDNAEPAQARSVDTNYGPKTNKVFVANLSYDTDEDSLREAFGKFGTIVGDIGMPIRRETGQIKGIAYIQFETEDEAEKAVKEMNGIYLNGRPIRTDFSGDSDKDRLHQQPSRPKFADRFVGRGQKKNNKRGTWRKH